MSVASKNLFALLGNDEEDNTPQGPVKTVDKNSLRSTKRNVEPQAPIKPANNTGAKSRPGAGGNEGAFRDRNAGSASNQRKGTDEAPRGGGRGGRGARERGGRGGRFPRERDDRHSKSQATGSEKQAAQSWGAAEGEAEQKDEQAGEAIAQSEIKDAIAEDAVDEAEVEEDKSVSYADYLAQQAEKKLALGNLSIRKPNEGSKADKKWADAKPLAKNDDEEEFISGSAGKARRERERKVKQVVEIDQRYVEPERTRAGPGARGGGAPRGGGRGEGRGGRGRGDGAPRGRGRGDGPRPRGGGKENSGFNAADQSAFPSLGA